MENEIKLPKVEKLKGKNFKYQLSFDSNTMLNCESLCTKRKFVCDFYEEVN